MGNKIVRPNIRVSWGEKGAIIEPNETKIQQGWIEEIPPMQYENFWHNRVDNTLRYLLQTPIPEWSDKEDYFSGVSFVLGSDNIIYQAIADSGVSLARPINPTGDVNKTVWRNILVYTVNKNNSATTTKLETPRKISGVSFDGSADITLSASDVGALGEKDNAVSATKLKTARKIGGVDFDGTKDIKPNAKSVVYAATVEGETSGKNSNITELAGLEVALSIAQGGTNAKTISQARENFELDKFRQEVNDSRIYKKDFRGYLVISQDGTVGYYDISANTLKWSFDGNGRMQTGIVPVARVEGLEPILKDMIPVGVPVPWPQEIPPDGFIMMYGQAFSRSEYPALALVYPSLRLPDMRGNFIRGWDNQRGYDPNRVILSQQEDTMQEMKGTVVTLQGGTPTAVAGVFYKDNNLSNIIIASNSPYPSQGAIGFNNTLVARTSTENRPKNISFNYIVRAR